MVAILGIRRGGYITLSTIVLSIIFLYSYGQTNHGASTYDTLQHHISSSSWYPSSSRSTPCFGAIEHGRKVLLDVYGSALKGVTHVAIVDWPWHHNSGDSAIWLGQVGLMEALGIEVQYICGIDDCKHEELVEAFSTIPKSKTAIMLHGGGNFGEQWASHQFIRNKIIEENPDRKIVHFPQTFEFNLKNPGELFKRTKELYAAHKDLIMVARDTVSFAQIEENFPGLPLRLAPDIAFFIGYDPASPLTPPIMRPPGSDMSVLGLKGPFHASFDPAPSRFDNASPRERSPLGWPQYSFTSPPVHDVVVLARSDREGGQDRQDASNWVPPLAPYDVVIQDWGDRWQGIKSPEKKHQGTIDNGAGEQISFTAYWHQAALLRVQWAMATLSGGKVVISDRLHTEIISTMIGLAHIVVETGELRKVGKVMDTWLSECVIPLEEMERTVGEQSGWRRKTDANTIFTHDNAEAVEAAKLFLKAEEHGARWSRVSE